jgi:dihydroneopterin aldolase
MTVKIALNDIKIYACHGALPQERQTGSYFTVSLLLTAPLENALSDDNLDSTIDYAAVYQVVEKEMQIPSNLLEHVAGRILRALKKRFPQTTEIELSLSKLNPPIGAGEIGSATVILKETY